MAVLSQQIVEKYEILEEIGSGGMGSIYKVRHRLLNEERVIKVMRPQMEQDEDHRERFLREARFAIRLRDQNIAQLYDFSIDEEQTYYIVMEYIDGLNLEQILKTTGPPKIPLAIEIARQSLRALGVLHHQGYVHRDVSPDNLMLTQDLKGRPLVKLIDLGIAKPMVGERNLTQTGLFMGKVRYASPEHFGGQEGNVAVEARSDIYSFGVVLYELLTGRYPVSGTNISSLVAGHLFQPPLDFAQADPEGRVPEPLRVATLKAISKAIDDRYASAEEFSSALEKIQREVEKKQGRAAIEPGTLSAPPGPVSPSAETAPATPLDQIAPSARRQATTLLPAEERKAAPRKAALATALEEVQLSLDAGHIEEAEAALRRAEGEFTGERELDAARRRLEQAVEQRERERQAAEQRAADLRDIRDLINREKLDEAERALDEAEGRYEKATDFAALRDMLERLRRDRREAEIAELLRAARAHVDSGELDAARQKAEAALELDPLQGQARALLDEVQAERDRAERLTILVSGLQAQLDRRDLAAAERSLEEAEAEFPDAAELQTLRRHLEELREEITREMEEPAEVLTVDRTVQLDDLPELVEGARAVEAKTHEPTKIIRMPRPEPAPAAQPAASTAAAPAPAPAEEPVRPQPRRPTPPRPAPAAEPRAVPITKAKLPLLIGLAAAALAAIGLILFLVFRGPSEPAASSDAAQQIDGAPGAGSPVGRLTLDALPWGQVTEVVDQDGTRHEIGGDGYTPLMLELPPGSYSISVTNPSFPQPQSLEIQIASGDSVTRSLEFARTDVDDYFKKAGWP